MRAEQIEKEQCVRHAQVCEFRSRALDGTSILNDLPLSHASQKMSVIPQDRFSRMIRYCHRWLVIARALRWDVHLTWSASFSRKSEIVNNTPRPFFSYGTVLSQVTGGCEEHFGETSILLDLSLSHVSQRMLMIPQDRFSCVMRYCQSDRYLQALCPKIETDF